MNKFIDFRNNKSEYIKIIVVTILINVLMIIIPLFQKNLIDMIANASLSNNKLLILFILGILLILFTLLESYLLVKSQLRIQKKISMNLLKSLGIIDSFVIKTRGSGAFMNSVFGDSEQISIMLGSTNYFMGIAYIFTSIIIMIITSRWMKYFPIIIISSYIIIYFLLTIIQKKQKEYFTKAREEIFKLNPKTLEFIENRKTIMSSSSFEKYMNILDQEIDKRDKYFKKSMTASNLSISLIDSIKNIGLIVTFIVAIIMIESKDLMFSDFIAIVSYYPTTFLPIYYLKEIKENKNKVEMIYDRNKDSYEAIASFNLPKNNKVSIDHVSLSYDDKLILDDISLDIDKIYGLVGVSGEGKTSIFKLLTGDLLPQSGEVRFGDVDISDINLGLRYSLYKSYFQDNEIFNSSLKENIVLKKSPVSSEEFEKLKDYYFLKFKEIGQVNKYEKFDSIDYDIFLDILDIKDLDESEKNLAIMEAFKNTNYNTFKLLADIKVNKNYYIKEKYDKLINDLNITYLEGRELGQRGLNISGGEKNKICLARLLLQETELPYLIDEPFTNVDLLSEKQSVSILSDYLQGKNGIIISHKLDLLNYLSDELIVLENGKIKARGNHQDLLYQSKLYKDLYDEYENRRFNK